MRNRVTDFLEILEKGSTKEIASLLCATNNISLLWDLFKNRTDLNEIDFNEVIDSVIEKGSMHDRHDLLLTIFSMNINTSSIKKNLNRLMNTVITDYYTDSHALIRLTELIPSKEFKQKAYVKMIKECAIKNPDLVFDYIKDLDKDVILKAVIASSNALYMYIFAKKILKENDPRLEDALIKTGDAENIYMYALVIKDANIDKLTDAICKSSDEDVKDSFVRAIDCDIRKFVDAYKKKGKYDDLITFCFGGLKQFKYIDYITDAIVSSNSPGVIYEFGSKLCSRLARRDGILTLDNSTYLSVQTKIIQALVTTATKEDAQYLYEYLTTSYIHERNVSPANIIKLTNALCATKNASLIMKAYEKYSYPKLWPNLDKKSVALETGNIKYIDKYVLTVGMDNETEAYLRKFSYAVAKTGEPKMIYDAALKYHSLVIKILEDAIIKTKNAQYIYMFARDIKGANISRLESELIKLDEGYLLEFALNVPGANIGMLEDAIIADKNTNLAYFFARDIKGANIEKLEDLICRCGTSSEILCFAKNIRSADMIKLTSAIIARGECSDIYDFLKLHGCDVKAIEDYALKRNSKSFISDIIWATDKLDASKLKTYMLKNNMPDELIHVALSQKSADVVDIFKAILSKWGVQAIAEYVTSASEDEMYLFNLHADTVLNIILESNDMDEIYSFASLADDFHDTKLNINLTKIEDYAVSTGNCDFILKMIEVPHINIEKLGTAILDYGNKKQIRKMIKFISEECECFDIIKHAKFFRRCSEYFEPYEMAGYESLLNLMGKETNENFFIYKRSLSLDENFDLFKALYDNNSNRKDKFDRQYASHILGTNPSEFKALSDITKEQIEYNKIFPDTLTDNFFINFAHSSECIEKFVLKLHEYNVDDTYIDALVKKYFLEEGQVLATNDEEYQKQLKK